MRACALHEYGAPCAFPQRCAQEGHPPCYVSAWLAVWSAERGTVAIDDRGRRRVVRSPEQEQVLLTWREAWPFAKRWMLADAQAPYDRARTLAGKPRDGCGARRRDELEGVPFS